MIKFRDDQEGGGGKVKTLPACKECCAELMANGIIIVESREIKKATTFGTNKPPGNKKGNTTK